MCSILHRMNGLLSEIGIWSFSSISKRNLLPHIPRMHGGESGKTFEVRAVEGEQARHSMNFKHRRKMSIVDLNAAHFTGDKKALPNRADAFRFRQQYHPALNRFQQLPGLFNRAAESVLLQGTCTHIPEFAEVLRRKTKFRALHHQTTHRG